MLPPGGRQNRLFREKLSPRGCAIEEEKLRNKWQKARLDQRLLCGRIKAFLYFPVEAGLVPKSDFVRLMERKEDCHQSRRPVSCFDLLARFAFPDWYCA